MKKIMCLIACLAIFSGCASQNLTASKCETDEAKSTCGVGGIEIPSKFEATLSCIECQSATSVIAFNEDNTFRLETILNKKTTQTIVETGTFVIKGDTIIATNQYKESYEYKFDGVNLIKIASNNAFIKESLFQDTVYKPTK